MAAKKTSVKSFQIETSDHKQFKKVMIALAAISDEATVILSSNQLEMRAIDPAHVAMFALRMSSKGFTTWSVKDKWEMVWNLEKIAQIVPRLTKKVVISGSENSHLSVVDTGHTKKAFQVPLLDSLELPKTPSIELSTMVEMDSQAFNKRITEMGWVSDYLNLECKGKKLILSAKSDDVDGELEMEEDVKITGPDCIVSLSVQYLKDIIKPAEVFDTVTLHLGTELPAKIVFETENTTLEYMMAPRVES